MSGTSIIAKISMSLNITTENFSHVGCNLTKIWLQTYGQLVVIWAQEIDNKSTG